MRWFLRWVRLCAELGKDVRTVPERMKAAAQSAAARRGLSLSTRKTYGGWAARYGAWAGSAQRAMDPAVARAFLTHLVEERRVSFSTQRQALNGLVFFFKDVCQREEVDLQVKMRKVPPKEPVVLDVEELLALIEMLAGVYQLAAKLQAGSGLRRKELVSLRIKDVDLKNRTVTVRRGKGQKDRVTVLPEALVQPLEQWKEEIRSVWEADRAAGRPGVAMPGAMERRMSKACERWEWFWLFPATNESRDPDSGIIRRHHLHPGVYSRAVSKAAIDAGIEKWVTSHAFRHFFATMLLRNGTDIRTVQELLGHEDVTTTEGYTHAATGVGKAGVKSPVDGLF